MALISCVIVLLAVLGHCTCNICDSGSVRIRLANATSGFIYTVGDEYSANTNCLWFIETDNPSGYVHLKFEYFDLECLWDYLHIFSGDSIYGNKLAAYSGDVLLPSDHVIENGSGSGDTPFLSIYDDNQVILLSQSSQLLLNFFADAAVGGRGFNVSYWVSTCIAGCSNRGICDEVNGICHCESDWKGHYCQYASCPNDCHGNGHCLHGACSCFDGFDGYDCSLYTSISYWKVLSNFTINNDNIGTAGASSVLWGGAMWVFGGYKFDTPINAHASSSGSGIEIEGRSDSAQFLRYNIESDTWEILRADSAWPRPRHAHSAIVYKDSMYVFGGSILPDERITDELWKFDFGTLKWYEIDTRTNRSESLYYPIAVKHHTSAVVDDKMLILFGYSYFDSLLNYVQEFDLVNETWLSSPPQYGKIPSGRMGHTSVYVPELQLIFVYGGFLTGNQGHHISTLLSYDPRNFHWSDVSSSHVGLAFHTTVLMGGALVIVGGTSSADCFYNYTLIYDLILDEWRELRDVPGFHGNVGRYGHSFVSLSDGNMLVFGGFKGQVYSQLLTLNKANCSSLTNDSCLSSLCYWSEDDATCSDITLDPYRSKTSSCHLYSTCITCNQITSCLWSNTTNHCTYNSSLSSSITNCTSPSLDDDCSNYDQCQTCSTHNHCHWSSNKCSLLSPSDNVTMETCPPSSADNRCSSMTTCSSCIHGATNCLWCPSLSQCVPSALYPHSFIYGQCLAWTTSCKTASCEDQLTCDNCTGLAGCGWCRDPANTGLGSCIPGGFTESLNATSCTNNHWFFDTCPLCHCNGHSSCVNGTTCISCRDNTEGDNCQYCRSGYYGHPLNGRLCSECDCNGYSSTCNSVNGTCACGDAGVGGPNCNICNTIKGYQGNASNFCYYPLSVGYIYTFGPTTSIENEVFYVTRPANGNRLNIKFELSRSSSASESLTVQFFLGRLSQSYLLLYNVTDPIRIFRNSSFYNSLTSFSSYTSLFSFARHSSQISPSLINVTSSDYTSSLWDGDVGLVIYISDLKPRMNFRVTIDQNDLMFLVYFFLTFLACFTVLLVAFFFGWYIKRKIEVRALIRAQHIEMQRRVRRPFTRVKTLIEKRPLTRTKQNASYIAVETVRDTKAAILTLMIRFPFDRQTGHPRPNRTGICFGSTFVKMNSSKNKDKKSSLHLSS